MKKASKWQYQLAKIIYYILFGFVAFFCVVSFLCGEFLIGVLSFALAALFFFIARKQSSIVKHYDNVVPAASSSSISPAVNAPADRSEKAEEQIPPAADPAPVVPAVKTPAQAQNVKKYKVAGVTHYVDNILELAAENPDYDLSKREFIAEDRVQERVWKYFFAPQKVELVPEYDNPQDPKAIKVIVDGQHVGYIKSGSCAHLRKVIDQGGIVDIDCTIGGGPYKYVALEYDDETDKEIYTLEKDETHIFVHLDITEKA